MIFILLQKIQAFNYLDENVFGHPVYSVAITPDGSTRAFCLQNGVVGIQSPVNNQIRTLSFNCLKVYISDDGIWIAFIITGQNLKMHQNTIGGLVYSFSISQQIRDMSFQPASSSHIIVTSLAIKFFDSSRALLGSISGNDYLSVHQSNNYVVVITNTLIYLYNRGRNLLDHKPLSASQLSKVRISLNEKIAVVCGDQLQVYKVQGNRLTLLQNMNKYGITDCKISADANTLVTSYIASKWQHFQFNSKSNKYEFVKTWNQYNIVKSIAMTNDRQVHTANQDGKIRRYTTLCTPALPYTHDYECITACPTGYIFNSTNHCILCTNFIFSNACVDPCPTNSYIVSPKTCQLCDNNCATCDTAPANCLTCHSAAYFKSSANVCVICTDNCQICGSTSTCSTCLNTFWLDFKLLTCATQCMLGQYKSQQARKCKVCDDACIDCTMNQCNLCSQNFLMDSSKQCYVCKCFNCASQCPQACSSNLNQLGIKCFSKCPSGYYKKDRMCKACAQPCKTCKSLFECQSCTQGKFLLRSTCYQTCPLLYFKDVKECSSCLVSGTMIDNPTCRTFIPKFYYVSSSSPSPFESTQLSITFHTRNRIKLETVSDASFQVRILRGNQDKSSCFQIYHLMTELDRTTLRIKNKGCQLSSLTVSVTSAYILDQNEIPFTPLRKLLTWELTVPGLQPTPGVLLSQYLILGKQYVKYLHYFPIVLLIFPSLRLNLLLAFYSGVYPYQCYNLISLFASSSFSVGQFGFRAKDWNIMSLYSEFNIQDYPDGTVGKSGVYLVDASAPILWFAVTGGFLILSSLFFSSANYIANVIFYMMIVAISLQISVYFVSTIRIQANLFESPWLYPLSLRILGLVGMVLVPILYIYSWFKQADKLKTLQSLKLDDRLQEYTKLDYMVSQLKWSESENSNEGIQTVLNPIFHPVLQLSLDVLLFVLFCGSSKSPYGQSALLIFFSGLTLLKIILLNPFKNIVFAAINASKQICTIVFASLQIYAELHYSQAIRALPSRLLVTQAPLDFWLNLGWALTACFLLIAALGIASDLFSLIRRINKKQYLLQLKDLEQRDFLKTGRQDQVFIGKHLQEIQCALIVRTGNLFMVKAITHMHIIHSKQKKILQSLKPIVIGKEMRTVLTVNESHRLFPLIKELIHDLDIKNFSKMAIRTFGTIDIQQARENEQLTPRDIWNRVQTQSQQVQLKGDKALIWCPVVNYCR